MPSRSILAIAGLAALATLATAAARAVGPNYDGVWTFQGTTDVGPCQKAFSGEVSIEGNDIVSSSDAAARAVGVVEASGVAWARFTRQDGQARASGRFHGAMASGAWSSNTAYCGGRWTARRKS